MVAVTHKRGKLSYVQISRQAVYAADVHKLSKAERAELPANTILYWCHMTRQWNLQPCTCRDASWNDLMTILNVRVRRIPNRNAVEVVCGAPSWRSIFMIDTLTSYIMLDDNAAGKFAKEAIKYLKFVGKPAVQAFDSKMQLKQFIKHMLTNPEYPCAYERLLNDIKR